MPAWSEAEKYSDLAGDVPVGAEYNAKRLELVMKGLDEAELCFSKAEQEGGLDKAERLGHCFKWRSVLRSKFGDMQGTADKIRNSYGVRDDAVKACERLPHDSVANHVLGAFYYHVANLSWVERNVASAVFHAVPSHTFQEAIPFLHKAQDADPTFIRNALMLGDAYKNVGKTAEAKQWYAKCAALTPSVEVEKSLVAECLKKM